MCGRYALDELASLPRFLGTGVFLSVMLAGCAVWPLGQDPYGRRLEAEGGRVAAAIRAYRARNGESPSSIVELVPDFLPRAPDSRLHYDPAHDQVSFAYSSFLGSGRAMCSTTIDVIAWKCEGFL
jgi:hypothetical protein